MSLLCSGARAPLQSRNNSDIMCITEIIVVLYHLYQLFHYYFNYFVLYQTIFNGINFEEKITIIIALIHIITYYTNYINYDTYTYYTFYTNYTTNNVCNLWICLQSFRITNMPQVLDLILLTTKICLTKTG